jgi:hypothetical protein
MHIKCYITPCGFKAADLQKVAENCHLTNISKPPSIHYVFERNRNDASKCSYFNIIALKTTGNIFYGILSS